MGADNLQVAEILSTNGLKSLEDPKKSDEIRDEYARMGVVQVDDFADGGTLSELGTKILGILGPYRQQAIKKHVILEQGPHHGLATGFSFNFIDPGRVQEPTERAALQKRFTELGIWEMGERLGRQLTPWVVHVIGRPMIFKKIYCFVYEEGDYISPHNDSQTGDRVNVQFPIPIATTTAFRALEESGRFRLYYDNLGCVRILGPKVWHEVLPVLRQAQAEDPCRLLLSLRYSQ